MPWLASTFESLAVCHKGECKNGFSTAIKEGSHRKQVSNTSEGYVCRGEFLKDWH